jgi:hypothetical protein
MTISGLTEGIATLPTLLTDVCTLSFFEQKLSEKANKNISKVAITFFMPFIITLNGWKVKIKMPNDQEEQEG